MNFRRAAAIGRKEFLQVRRDPQSLTIALILPLVQILLLGYGARLDAKNIAVCVLDQEGTQDTYALLAKFQASSYFDVVKVVKDYHGIIRGMNAGECELAIVIPSNFSEQLSDTHRSTIQTIIDGSDTNSAQLAQAYTQELVATYASGVRRDWFARQGLSYQATLPVSVEYRTWFNEDLESKCFILPGAIALVVALMGALLSSLTITRERERGTMEQLIASPVTPLEILVGKLVPYLLVGLVDTALCVVFAVQWFGVPFRGGLGALILSSTLFLATVLGIGYMISVAAKSQLGASQFALLVTLLPTSMLSGFTFSIDQMPTPIRAISYLVYSRYYVSALRRIFLGGATISDLGPQIMAMAIYATIVSALAIRAFKKQLS